MKGSKKNEGEGERRRSTHKTTKAHRRNGPSLLIGLFLAPLQALRHWRKREKRRSRRAETVHTQKHKDAAERERERERESERERETFDFDFDILSSIVITQLHYNTQGCKVLGLKEFHWQQK